MSVAVAVAVSEPDPAATQPLSPQADALIKEIGIPPCPGVLAEFLAESSRDEPDFRRLSHLINKDVALSGSVLKTINSPFYGLTKKARTVQDALALLGLRETSRLIAALLLRRAFASWQSPAMHEFWDASSRIAMIAAYLARELEAARLDEAHTFALFRDCGIPVLLTRFPEYESLVTETRCENEERRSAIERERYGFDHALVSATLAQSWHLPSDMWQSIRIHNAYDQPGFRDLPDSKQASPLIALALLAEQLYRVHRGTYDSVVWVAEERFINAELGSVAERVDALSNDIRRILGA